MVVSVVVGQWLRLQSQRRTWKDITRNPRSLHHWGTSPACLSYVLTSGNQLLEYFETTWSRRNPSISQFLPYRHAIIPDQNRVGVGPILATSGPIPTRFWHITACLWVCYHWSDYSFVDWSAADPYRSVIQVRNKDAEPAVVEAWAVPRTAGVNGRRHEHSIPHSGHGMDLTWVQGTS